MNGSRALISEVAFDVRCEKRPVQMYSAKRLGHLQCDVCLLLFSHAGKLGIEVKAALGCYTAVVPKGLLCGVTMVLPRPRWRM